MVHSHVRGRGHRGEVNGATTGDGGFCHPQVHDIAAMRIEDLTAQAHTLNVHRATPRARTASEDALGDHTVPIPITNDGPAAV